MIYFYKNREVGSVILMNKKGQALVEFVLILPVVLILIFSSIDIFHLIMEKNDLDSTLNDEVELYINEKIDIDTLKKDLVKYDVKTKNKDNYLTIVIKKEVKWISPITNTFLKHFTITSKKVIYSE